MFKNLVPWRKHTQKQSVADDSGAPSGGQLTQMRDAFDSMFDRLWGGELSLPEDSDRWNVGWGCDVKDGDKEIVVRAEAPGFEPDEIDIKMSGNQLVLQAEHREESKKNGDQVSYGSFYRSMTMPRGIESEKITAEYKNGVLEVHLPKGAQTHARRIAVKAK